MPNQINVSSMSQLYDALANAAGGETILLEGGDYGDMTLTKKSGFDVTFPSNVTIASADPDNPAVFSGLDLRGASNLTFDGITFDYEFQLGDKISARPFALRDSTDITIRNSTFDGDVAHGMSDIDDGYGYAIGLYLWKSAGVNVENNEFFDFARGTSMKRSSDVTVSGNDIHSIRHDAMTFSQMTHAVIEDNYIHDMRGSLKSNDHRDMIQFWTTDTDAPSTDITIRNNHLDIGEGTATQSIFMGNELVKTGQAGAEMFYRDIVIEDNVIANGHWHGITVGETDGLSIRNNSVLHAVVEKPGGGETIGAPWISVSSVSKDVQIENNATSVIKGEKGQADWTLSNNVFVQDRDADAPGYYGDVFVSKSLEPVDGVHNFQAAPDGLLYNPPVGATATRSTSDVSDLAAQFPDINPEEAAALHHFDASSPTADQDVMPQQHDNDVPAPESAPVTAQWTPDEWEEYRDQIAPDRFDTVLTTAQDNYFS